ncbi:MAG: hypothetical protein WCO45_17800 [Pseudanabaena sp. ELA607]
MSEELFMMNSCKKQSLIITSALAVIAGFTLSLPNAASATNLITYDFGFYYDNSNNDEYSGSITVDDDNISTRTFGSGGFFSFSDTEEAVAWNANKWVNFVFHSIKPDARIYTLADVTLGSSFHIDYYSGGNSQDGSSSSEYGFGSYLITLEGSVFNESRLNGNSGVSFLGFDASFRNPMGYFADTNGPQGNARMDGTFRPSIHMRHPLPGTPPDYMPIPVPGLALGVVTASAWLGMQQLRRKPQPITQEMNA